MKDRNFSLQLSTNKFFEIDLGWNTHECERYYSIELDWTRKRDHAGPKIWIEIGRLYLSIMIYDCRHWDRENNCYFKKRSYLS